LKGANDALLRLGRSCIVLHVIQGKSRIPLCLRWALREISQRLASDKIVVVKHALHALTDDLRREQFGKRRRDRCEKRSLADKVDIGIDGKSRSREQPLQ